MPFTEGRCAALWILWIITLNSIVASGVPPTSRVVPVFRAGRGQRMQSFTSLRSPPWKLRSEWQAQFASVMTRRRDGHRVVP
jgi:hypothetical protein